MSERKPWQVVVTHEAPPGNAGNPSAPSISAGLESVCPRCLQTVQLNTDCVNCAQGYVDPHLGAIIDGRYEIESTIGSGGVGNVYSAKRLDLGGRVAIKLLHEAWSGSSSLRARFRREAVVLARLRHPNIVSLLDFGEHGHELYMVMELVRGEPLNEVVDRGPLPPKRVGAIFTEILNVLEAAHAVNVIHRDMKPHNVMLLDPGDHTERVKVLDFGLAYVGDTDAERRLTETGMVQGTPVYMSPEQCRGQGIGAPTDIYAVGVMLFEALRGKPPFQGEESALMMAQHLFVEAPRLTVEGGPKFSEGLEDVVKRALAKEPGQRPTAPELRALLQAAIDGTDAERCEVAPST